MTFADLKTEVFRRVRESSSAPVFFSEEDIEASINEGYGEISDSSEWLERVRVVDVLPGRPYYDCYAFLDPCFLRIDAAYNLTTSRWLIHGHVPGQDGVDRHWEDRLSEPDRLLFRGIKWLSYWPYRSNLGGKVRQYYVAVPDTLCEDTDEPGFPEQFHQGLVEYALYDLFTQDGEATLAMQSWEAYLAYDNSLTEWVNKRVAIPYRMGYGEGHFGS